MELSDLRIFKAVIDAGGITGAARILHRVPSNVTTRIRQLEAGIGADLFLREGGRLALSARGKTLSGYADRLLQLAEEAASAVRDDLPRGPLRLGALESTTASRLPALLAGFHRACPEVAIELVTGTNDAMTLAVVNQQVDLAFVVERPVDDRLDSSPAFRERLVLIAPHDSPPLRTARDVSGRAVLAFPTGCAYRRRLERWLGQRRAPSVRTLELGSYHAIVTCVAAGVGIAVVPESVLAVVSDAQVSRHPLPQAIADVRTCVVWRRNDVPAPALALRQWVGRSLPRSASQSK